MLTAHEEGIGALCDVDGLAQFLLGKVLVLTYVPQSQIHIDHQGHHILDCFVIFHFILF